MSNMVGSGDTSTKATRTLYTNKLRMKVWWPREKCRLVAVAVFKLGLPGMNSILNHPFGPVWDQRHPDKLLCGTQSNRGRRHLVCSSPHRSYLPRPFKILCVYGRMDYEHVNLVPKDDSHGAEELRQRSVCFVFLFSHAYVLS